MYPELTLDQVAYVSQVIRDWHRERKAQGRRGTVLPFVAAGE
jgi:hypothetical protein